MDDHQVLPECILFTLGEAHDVQFNRPSLTRF